LGPFQWRDPDGDAEAFTEVVRASMVQALAGMRGSASA
jgi:hypothetical protein